MQPGDGELPGGIPPHILAALDQTRAAADAKYTELVDALRSLGAEYGEYESLSVLGASLLKSASKEVLVSIVLTGMQRELRDT